MSESFITYGCWNKGKCVVGADTNGVSAVITTMDAYVSHMKVKPAFIAIAGDNYYPKIEEATATTSKKKYFNADELKSGFACLRAFQRKHSIPIDLIGGNHDTETTSEFTISKLESSFGTRGTIGTSRRRSSGSMTSSRSRTYRDTKCLITNTEIDMASSSMMSFTMFNCRFIGERKQTLVLMLDSNIYIEDMAKIKLCYLPLLTNTIRHLKKSTMYPKQLEVSAFSDTIRDAILTLEAAISSDNIAQVIATLRSVQNAWINHILSRIDIDTIKNVVIVAHHPIAYHKIKKGKTLFEIGNDKDGKAEYLKLCMRIYTHFSSGKYFYSCADLHTYQAGTVILHTDAGAAADTKTSISINQQIAGSGGTTLETEYASKEHRRSEIVVDGISVSYTMTDAIHTHGFLHWTLPDAGSDVLSVIFIPAAHAHSSSSSSPFSSASTSVADKGGGTRRRRRTGQRMTMNRTRHQRAPRHKRRQLFNLHHKKIKNKVRNVKSFV